MNNMKYHILRRVHDSTVPAPLHRSDFYADTKRINQYRRSIDELIHCGYLSEAIGSDALSITHAGVFAMEDEQELRDHRRLEEIRYWITTAIAALALVISFISLIF